jgi:hypothetical protein
MQEQIQPQHRRQMFRLLRKNDNHQRHRHPVRQRPHQQQQHIEQTPMTHGERQVTMPNQAKHTLDSCQFQKWFAPHTETQDESN